MMNKKIALSLLSIVSALAIVGGATFAFFSDSGTSTQNVFSSGTLDLKLSDDTPEIIQDDVTASFGASDLAPGDCTEAQELRLRNSGTVNGNHVDITASNSDGTFAAFLRIDSLTYDSVDVTGNITENGGDGNSFLDLVDWTNDSDGLHNLGLTDLDTDHPLSIVVCLDESAGNSEQGGSDTLNLTATLRQQSHGSE